MEFQGRIEAGCPEEIHVLLRACYIMLPTRLYKNPCPHRWDIGCEIIKTSDAESQKNYIYSFPI